MSNYWRVKLHVMQAKPRVVAQWLPYQLLALAGCRAVVVGVVVAALPALAAMVTHGCRGICWKAFSVTPPCMMLLADDANHHPGWHTVVDHVHRHCHAVVVHGNNRVDRLFAINHDKVVEYW